MKIRLIEKHAYHYGDLDVGKKAELGLMGGRGTGHFGSGFYLVGKYDPDHAYSYSKRAHWVVDLDAYHLFKPSSNSKAYKLHDALKVINNTPDTIFKVDGFENAEHEAKKLWDKYEDALDEIEFNIYMDNEDIIDYQFEVWDAINDGRIIKEDWMDLTPIKQELYDGLKAIYDKYDLYLDTVYDNDGNEYIKSLEQVLSVGDAEYAMDDIREQCEDLKKDQSKFKSAVFEIWIQTLAKSEKEVYDICKEAVLYTQNNYEFGGKTGDSASTLVMKGLGYEGVDVTHLSEDAEGLMGPDNFTYGSVIYDLKPGTYKKIKDKTVEN